MRKHSTQFVNDLLEMSNTARNVVTGGEMTRRVVVLEYALPDFSNGCRTRNPGFLRETANLKKFSAPRRTECIKCA